VGRPVIIDTDGGVDDACALWWALTDPDLDVVAVTVVWGNVALDIAAGVVLRVLAAAGRLEVPVAVGAAGPMGLAPELRPAGFIHGDDGLGNVAGPFPAGAATLDESALDLLARVTGERPGEVSIVAIGPLTNLGLAVEADPDWAATVDELIVMGGSVARGGNALPLGEANVAHDPIAAPAAARRPRRDLRGHAVGRRVRTAR
jgi:inosine-uridine nucleoside N-ribohydrolase